ncbi:MAG: trimeric intracellular cation channel family protein [Chloroflexi bacterium SZAS-1]|jgi:uncharacterized membrane protein YeiH|nr:trimeric intracellular cation channel family protein [Chloroflexi bacterium SZAS-1]HNP86289.1 trimeric intracellular cation channel family protein [Kouleothrix sp.]
MLQTIEVLGIIAFALSGIAEAQRKQMDLVGIYAVAFMTAFGGGTLRDLLLDRTPLFWVEHQEYAILVLGLTLLALLFPAFTRIPARWLVLPDALGLGLFSVAGAGYAQAAGTSLFVASIMGVITGVFGGVIRDVVCNEIPYVFRNTHWYATCAFIGCWIYLLLDLFGVTSVVALPVAVGSITLLRLAALRYNFRMPVSG